MKKIIVAIDGLSSCGKSTMAKALAKYAGYIYVDTGAMYRAVALFAIREIHTEGAQYPQSNEISLITDLDGNNAKGEEVMSKFIKLIETNPILNRKAKDGATTAAATAGSAEAKDAVKNMKF